MINKGVNCAYCPFKWNLCCQDKFKEKFKKDCKEGNKQIINTYEKNSNTWT